MYRLFRSSTPTTFSARHGAMMLTFGYLRLLDSPPVHFRFDIVEVILR